ncbi:MAG: hypothetical protein ACRDRJ_03445 [Streptosporangiaceae bacterium]
MTCTQATTASGPPTAFLNTLTAAELAAADRRYPKWATMRQLCRIGLPVLDAVLITPGQERYALDAGIAALAAATGQDRLMIRSDGGAEERHYYKGGNTFSLPEAASKAAGLLKAERAVILMEPTNRFTNRLTAVMRMDRDPDGRNGTFTVEVLGPGYDVADLTRGGIPPQVTITADIDWSAYPDLWWSDLHLATNTSTDADRRERRLTRIASDILTDIGHPSSPAMTEDQQATTAGAWLREHGYDHLWQQHDTAGTAVRRVRGWLDDAFLITVCHPRRRWACLATATSDLGDRTIFWDIVDGSRKYATGRPA